MHLLMIKIMKVLTRGVKKKPIIISMVGIQACFGLILGFVQTFWYVSCILHSSPKLKPYL